VDAAFLCENLGIPLSNCCLLWAVTGCKYLSLGYTDYSFIPSFSDIGTDYLGFDARGSHLRHPNG